MTTFDNGEDYKATVEEIRKHDHGRIIYRLTVAVVILLIVIFVTLSQLFAWSRVRTLENNLTSLEQTTTARGSKADCLAFYRNDVTSALGLAVAANNKLFISLSARPPALTDEERIANAADNLRLGQQLAESNQPLIDASQALIEYDATDPPPDSCPHPNAANGNN